jgi:hypothetical protein
MLTSDNKRVNWGRLSIREQINYELWIDDLNDMYMDGNVLHKFEITNKEDTD